MDYTLEIFLLKEDLRKVGLKEQLFKWGEEEFPFEPKRYTDDSNMLFQYIEDINCAKVYCRKFIVNTKICHEDWRLLRLVGKNMFELERLINYKNLSKEELMNNDVMRFLGRLSKLKAFIVFLIKDEEIIDRKYELQDSKYELQDSKLIEIIYKCMKYEVSEGAIIIKE